MTKPGHNGRKERVAELRRKIRSATGKIDRRYTAIQFARDDIASLSSEIHMAKRELAELGTLRPAKRRPT